MINICYVSHHSLDKSSKEIGGNQVSRANVTLLKKLVDERNIEYINLSELKTKNIFFVKLIKLVRSIFGLSPCLGYVSMKAFLNSEKLKNADIIWCDGSYYGQLIKKINRKFPEKKIITFFHNVEFDFYKSIYPPTTYIKKLFIRSIKKNEKKVADYTSSIIALTQNDADRIEELYGKKVDSIIPVMFSNSTTLDLNCHKNHTNNHFNILFVGSDFPPNVEAIDFLCTQVMPYLNDNVVLTVVGNGMDKYKTKYQAKNIHIHGYMEDLSIFYHQCNLVVAPIFSGAGMKVKIVEAFKHAKAVLGTEFGFKGFNPDEKFIFIANNESEFIEFLNNPKQISLVNPEEILNYYNKYFTIESQITKLKSVIF